MWAGHVALMGEDKVVYRLLVGNPEGKRPVERTRRKWENNTKMALQELACRVMDWSNMAHDNDR